MQMEDLPRIPLQTIFFNLESPRDYLSLLLTCKKLYRNGKLTLKEKEFLRILYSLRKSSIFQSNLINGNPSLELKFVKRNVDFVLVQEKKENMLTLIEKGSETPFDVQIQGKTYTLVLRSRDFVTEITYKEKKKSLRRKLEFGIEVSRQIFGEDEIIVSSGNVSATIRDNKIRFHGRVKGFEALGLLRKLEIYSVLR